MSTKIETTVNICGATIKLHAAGRKSVRATLINDAPCPVFVQFEPEAMPDGLISLLGAFEKFAGDASLAETHTRAQYLRHINPNPKFWEADKSKLKRLRYIFGATDTHLVCEEINRAILAIA